MNSVATPTGAVVYVVEAADEVRIPLAAQILGTTEKSIRRRIERKVWREGREYFVREGEVWVSRRGVSRWVRGDAAAA